MQFGLFYEWPNPTLRNWKVLFDEGVRQIKYSEATHVSNWMMFGGLEHEKLMRSIRLMGEEVIPALRDLHPPGSIAGEVLREPSATNEELQASRFARSPRDMAT